MHLTLQKVLKNINFMYQCISSTHSVIKYIDVLHDVTLKVSISSVCIYMHIFEPNDFGQINQKQKSVVKKIDPY